MKLFHRRNVYILKFETYHPDFRCFHATFAPLLNKTSSTHQNHAPMKNIDELAKYLADLYGIEYVDAPVGHVVIASDDTEHPLEIVDFMDIFGVGKSPTKVWGVDLAALPRIFSYSSSFENFAPLVVPIHSFAASGKSQQATTNNHSYALAA